MSDATKAAMDTAIAVHFADVMEGALVGSYVLQIAGESMADLDKDQWSALRCTTDGQPFLTTLGLLAYAKRSMDLTMTEIAED